MSHVTHPLTHMLIYQHFSLEIAKFCYIQNHKYRLRFDTLVFKDCFNKYGHTFDDAGLRFKFNNLGLALKTNVAKRLKIESRKFWGLILTFVQVTGEKLVGGPFAPYFE